MTLRQVTVLTVLIAGGAAGRSATDAARKAPGVTPGLDSLRAARAQDLAELIRRTVRAPGLSAAVASGRRILWSTGVGFADPDDADAATAGTRYRIGSVSKLFTATAAAQLARAGRLDLDAPVGRYVPGLPSPLANVTARQLAGHLAGVRHYRSGAEYVNTRHYRSVGEALEEFSHDSLVAAPGTRYVYSSYGYVLLSAVVASAAGTAFTDEIRRAILGPLAMTATAPDRANETMASPFDRRGDDVVASPSVDLSDRWGAGGYVSTVRDLARFGTAVIDPGFVGDSVRALLFTGQRTADGQPTHVGMGWRIGTDARGRTVYSHGGTAIGGRAVLMVFPGRNLAVAIAANLGNAGFGEPEAKLLGELFLDSLSASTATAAAGRYRFERRGRHGAVRGTLVLDRRGGLLAGELRPDSGAPVPLSWSWAAGHRLDLAGPSGGALEIMWLRSAGDSLSGSTWRAPDDFRAVRIGVARRGGPR
jgi:serine beta-lactamase-like protein LACTB